MAVKIGKKAEMNSPILYAGYRDLWGRCVEMAGRLPEGVDTIAGVPVSGLAAAGMLSAASGVRAAPLEAIPEDCRTLLVLEDASEFCRFREAGMGAGSGRRVVYGAVYACGRALDELDVVGARAEKSRVFDWNLCKHQRLERFAFDLDGVLCRNPTGEETDYGVRYEHFLETVSRWRCPLGRIGWIVTGRREHYRAATERWLLRQGIVCNALVMAPDDLPRSSRAHAEFKAEWYKAAAGALVFVESSVEQAVRIHESSGRPVICTDAGAGYGTRSPEALPAAGAGITVPFCRALDKLSFRAPKRHDRVIYTISTGAYEEHAPVGARIPEGWDYRVITSGDCPDYLGPKRQAAWAKINGLRIFEAYSQVLCLDDDMEVLRDPWPLFAGAPEGIVTLRRGGGSATWIGDLRLVGRVRRAAGEDEIEAEIARLTARGFGDGPNYMTGVLYRLQSEAMRRLCDTWWFYYTQSETGRDQPSLAVACIEENVAPGTLAEADMGGYIVHHTRRADGNGSRYRVGDGAEPPPALRGQEGTRGVSAREVRARMAAEILAGKSSRSGGEG